jgi:hypothetical protein
LAAWIPAFIPDAFDYIFKIPPSDGAGMAFVFGCITFLSYPLTAIAIVIMLYKTTKGLAKLRDHSPKAN